MLLDISKVFDRAWHEGLILKLNQCFLKNRKQRVVLNGQTSSWTNVLAGVPQGSILGPLFFLIYINDLSDDLSSNPKLFADDTSLFPVVRDKNTSAKELNHDLRKMTKANHPTLIFSGNPVHQ